MTNENNSVLVHSSLIEKHFRSLRNLISDSSLKGFQKNISKPTNKLCTGKPTPVHPTDTKLYQEAIVRVPCPPTETKENLKNVQNN